MCDGLFLIEDTARHNNFYPDPREVSEHIAGCTECGEYGTDFADWAESQYDPDTHPWDRVEEMDGHA